jgi:hypothetical protein
MYKEKKVEMLQKNYPADKFEYNFAISDSDKDKQLLNKFNKHILYKN